jgi:hypothetical protein
VPARVRAPLGLTTHDLHYARFMARVARSGTYAGSPTGTDEFVSAPL